MDVDARFLHPVVASGLDFLQAYTVPVKAQKVSGYPEEPHEPDDAYLTLKMGGRETDVHVMS